MRTADLDDNTPGFGIVDAIETSGFGAIDLFSARSDLRGIILLVGRRGSSSSGSESSELANCVVPSKAQSNCFLTMVFDVDDMRVPQNQAKSALVM